MKKNQPYRWMLAAVGVALSLSTNSIPAFAQIIPVHAQGLKEELITVDLSGSKKQVGVFSTKIGSDKPTKLAVLLPGYPSVVRPVMENGL